MRGKYDGEPATTAAARHNSNNNRWTKQTAAL